MLLNYRTAQLFHTKEQINNIFLYFLEETSELLCIINPWNVPGHTVKYGYKLKWENNYKVGENNASTITNII
jgi:hypothetical protein